MRRSTAFLTAAALAIGGISLPSQVFGQQQNQTEAPGAANGQTGSSNSSSSLQDRESAQAGRHMDQVKGVQDLFARATDAAVSENGISQLSGMFASRQDMEAHEAGANRTGLSRDAAEQAGAARASGASNNGSRTGAAETAGQEARAAGAAAGQNADTHQLDQIVQQIRQEWKQKYNQDFKISNEAVVFSDITAADIGRREPRTAGSELRGTNPGESRDLSGDQRGTPPAGTSNERGTTGANTGASTDAGSSAASSSDRSGAYAHNDRTSSSASGSASSELNATARQAGERQMGHPITVNVPAVRGTEAVEVRVIHEGGDFKFASHNQIDQQKLQQALETHLREVQSSKSDWPADVNQGYRLVTQHVLMAINDATGHHGETGDRAQPAGSRIRGTGSEAGGNSATGNSSGDINRSSNTNTNTNSSSNTTGTGSNQTR